MHNPLKIILAAFAADIIREDLRWYLTLVFYGMLLYGVWYGLNSHLSAQAAFDTCMINFSYGTCMETLR